MDLDEHIKRSVEFRERQAAKEREGRQRELQARQEQTERRRRQVAETIKSFRDDVGNREHFIYAGKGIPWFLGDSTISRPRDWGHNVRYSEGTKGPCGGGGSHYAEYEFRGRQTTQVSESSGGIYLADWDISIRDIFVQDIIDYRTLSGDPEVILGHVRSGSQPLRSKINSFQLRRRLQAYL